VPRTPPAAPGQADKADGQTSASPSDALAICLTPKFNKPPLYQAANPLTVPPSYPRKRASRPTPRNSARPAWTPACAGVTKAVSGPAVWYQAKADRLCLWAAIVENASDVIAADGKIDADCSLAHEALLRGAGEVLGDAAMCLIRGRLCRHNLFTLACPGRVRGSSSRCRDAGELSLLDDARGPVAQERG
jgi:hypothetical protein